MTPLLPHQRRCIEAATKSPLGLFLEMGLGKTRIALELMPDYPSLSIVVCPISVKHTWESEAQLWRMDIVVKSTIGLNASKRQKVRAQVLFWKNENPTILLINYEQAAETVKWLKSNQIRPKIAVADESTYIKNHKAKRSKAMHALALISVRCYALTGTPVLQGPLDLYSQLEFVNNLILPENYYAFRSRYAIMGGFERKQVVGYKNLDHLTKRIKDWTISIKKEDVALDLPPKIYVERCVNLSPKERKNYDTIKKEAILSLPKGEFVPLVNALSKLAKLMQASSGFNYIQNGFKRDVIEYGKTKRQAAIELITEGDLAGQPTVIWSVFIHELQAMHTELVKAGVNITSEINHKTPSEAARAFINGQAGVLLLNPASMSHGVNLQRATAEIFLSNNFKYGDREQAEARCHRIGQQYPVTIVDIISQDTIDRKILRVLSKKAELADVVTSELGVKIQR
jgi:SNF2 family DNA or RNA helicase